MWNPRKKIFYVIFIFYLINKFFFVFISLSLSLLLCVYIVIVSCLSWQTHTHTHMSTGDFFYFSSINKSIRSMIIFLLYFFRIWTSEQKKTKCILSDCHNLSSIIFFSCFRFIISFNHHHHQLLLDDHQQHHWHSSIISLFFCFQSHHIIDWNEKVHVRLCRFMEYVTLLFIFLFLLLLLLLLFFHILFWGEGRKKEKMFFRDQQFM